MLNYMIFRHFLQTLLLFALLLVPSASAQDIPRPQPEITTGMGKISRASGKDFMIVTANPYATRAGYDILKKGGNAVDAAITAQAVLGLVEPQSSGLGGGAFVLYYDAQTKKLSSYDARETAPNLAGPFLFQPQGKPMAFYDAVVGGRAVGVPGIPALLKDMHDLHGGLTWMELFDAPIRLAEEGFTVSPRLAKMIAQAAPRLSKNAAATQYFLPHGQPLTEGQTLANPAYAETLKDFSFYGAAKFYRGRYAQDIVTTVQNIPDNPGLLTVQDFADYTAKARAPVCGPYRAHIVCAMGEPSSGGLTLLEALGMLEHFDLSQASPQNWGLISQASALAFADRNMYMADPDFVNTPNVALLQPEYLKSRAALMNVDKPLESVQAGTPPNWTGPLYQESDNIDKPGTTHISIIDKFGNALSMTSSIEGAFGSHVMVNGYLLNNQLTDFSFTPFDETQSLVANMVEGGKRPRSSMSPTIIFNSEGAPVMILGSAGGSRIIGYVLQRIIAALDWDMNLAESLAAPHTLARGAQIETEDKTLEIGLKSLGYEVNLDALGSGLTAIMVKGDTLEGAADPRREGLAQGE